MKQAFLALQAFLIAQLSSVTLPSGAVVSVNYVRMWNNQLERLINGDQSDFSLFGVNGDTPAILIEFVSPATIMHLGNGVQIYDPLDIRVHILHQFFDAQDGTQDQDVVVLDIAEAVYFALNSWFSSTVAYGQFVRISEEWDYDHPDVYHFVQTYRTTYVDTATNLPIGGTLSSSNDTLTLNIQTNQQPS